MKEKTYYIVKHTCKGTVYDWEWTAHKRGIRSTFGIYDIWNKVTYSSSHKSANDCEENLRKILSKKGIKSKVVRVLKI